MREGLRIEFGWICVGEVSRCGLINGDHGEVM